MTEPSAFDDDAEVVRLAALSALAYEREREPAAQRLGVRVGTFDKAAGDKRAERSCAVPDLARSRSLGPRYRRAGERLTAKSVPF